MSPRAGLDRGKEKYFLPLPKIEFLDRPARSPLLYQLRFPESRETYIMDNVQDIKTYFCQ
jgi:hypothetical protein